jgi:hypothetical protein
VPRERLGVREAMRLADLAERLDCLAQRALRAR